MTQFTDLGLAEPILRAVSAAGYTTPTPIQANVIPVMLEGRDVLGIAQTGTGKTASFVLPLLTSLHGETMPPKPKTASVLILAPTRELAAQILDSIRTYAKFMRLSTALVVGGAKPLPQIRRLQGGVDICVATPGRLLDHASNGAIKLNATRAVVLDEADQMMDLGFLPAIRKIMSALPRDRQTLLLSATMPKQIASLAQDFLNEPERIEVAPQSRPIERIEQKVMHLDRRSKRPVLAKLLSDTAVESAVVFTRTKHGADNIQRFLENKNLNCAAIHGNKSQGQRDRTLQAFRKGNVKILVATDIAARGIDVDGVTHVVNYDMPNIPESYVHRIGRTGRAGKSGTAYSLVDSSERSYLRQIEKLIGMSLESFTVPFEVDTSPMNDSDEPQRSHRGPHRPDGRRNKPRPAHGHKPRHHDAPRTDRESEVIAHAAANGTDGEESRSKKPRFNDRKPHKARHDGDRSEGRKFGDRRDGRKNGERRDGQHFGKRREGQQGDVRRDGQKFTQRRDERKSGERRENQDLSERREGQNTGDRRENPKRRFDNRKPFGDKPRRTEGQKHSHGRPSARPEGGERGLTRKRDANKARNHQAAAKPQGERKQTQQRRDGTHH